MKQGQACAGRLRLSKFQPCLSERLLDEFLADGLDVEGAVKAVAAVG
ncbi:MAG: hypothetical protein IPM79_19065 [Polyangiaceae bacterium]|nr:hypothetical protein [Polyangiaceae bacterium]